MSIDSVGLLAQQSYSQIQDRPKMTIAETPMTKAVEFQQMVDKQFNSFAKMSPAQILNHIQGAKQASGATHSLAAQTGEGAAKGLFSSASSTLRNAISKQETTGRKMLIGEASMVDLLAATTEAKNVMETTVRVRDKFLEAYDKVMNMNM